MRYRLVGEFLMKIRLEKLSKLGEFSQRIRNFRGRRENSRKRRYGSRIVGI